MRTIELDKLFRHFTRNRLMSPTARAQLRAILPSLDCSTSTISMIGRIDAGKFLAGTRAQLTSENLFAS